MAVVEMFVRGMLMWSPPAGTVDEGPEPPSEAPGEAAKEEPAPSEDDEPANDVDRVVQAAAQAAKERAYLERSNRDIEEYVRHLDALADIGPQLDACGQSIQAELRMSLALAYLKVAGTCSETGESGEASGEPTANVELPMPVLECIEAEGPSQCAQWLLERVAEFADAGPGGTEAPFSLAFGCPHAVAEMSVEQMFGSCMVGEYERAVQHWDANKSAPVEDDVVVWPVPRWASIGGISAGAALILSGAVLLAIDGKCPGGYDPVTEVADCPSIYTTNVAGGVFVGLGAVVVVGMGAVLTITEIQRSKQGKTRPSALRRGLDRVQARTGLRLAILDPNPL